MDKQQILIVDDEPLVISELAGFLRDEPYAIFTAENGIEGLEILRKEEIGLAVVEIHVEDMDGMTILKRVKAEKIQTAILIMSDLGNMELGAEVIKAGGVSVFDKPIKKDVFLAEVKKYMPPQDIWKSWLESFLEANYSNPKLRFKDVMRHFRFSESYGHKLFKKHLGMPYRMCLRNVRLTKAEKALQNTSYTLSEVAYLCGFASLSTFSKVFKETYGVSPSTYRKK
ncbi:MAG: response regulator transcription factor [Gemmatimonadetes bacterium]|nr:response regulator transcription factor [Gemmatimonadota bacterium]MYF52873.1 response regulator transcription factor [Gammaproteobacteria bacterium]MYK44544.1 response regulator transcription factor [Gammaproteobacteria bacterium]